MLPNSFNTSFANSWAVLNSAALDWYPFALTPKEVNAASKVFAASTEELYVNATLAPCLANSTAIPRPIPLVAPVIIAVLFSSNFIS